MSPLRYTMCFVDSDEPYFDSIDHLDKAFVIEAFRSHVSEVLGQHQVHHGHSL